MLPHGVHVLAWATTIRWVGWGFFEALLPVFLFSFSNSYAETGLLQSTFDVVFLIAMPFVGMLADKISAKTIIMVGLLFYPFVGASYFMAGASGIVLFVVIARVFNAFGFAFESVGRNTYFMRHVAKSKIATAFGYFETLANFWWILAVLSGIFILRAVPLHWLFLILIPTHLIAFFMVSRLKPDKPEGFKEGMKNVFREGAYVGIWREIKTWGAGLRIIGFLVFFLGFITPVVDFFIPIYTYTQTGSFDKVIIIAAVMALPSLFGSPLGKIADKYRKGSILFGFSALAILILSLAFTPVYWVQLLIAFLIKTVLELIDLASDGLATRIIHPEHYGRLNSVMGEVGDVGELMGPIVLGFMLEGIGTSHTFGILSAVTLLIVLVLAWRNRDFDKKYHISLN